MQICLHAIEVEGRPPRPVFARRRPWHSVSPCPLKQQYRSAPFASGSLKGLERHRKSRRNQLLFPKNGLPILPACNMKGDKGANIGVARKLTGGEALRDTKTMDEKLWFQTNSEPRFATMVPQYYRLQNLTTTPKRLG